MQKITQYLHSTTTTYTFISKFMKNDIRCKSCEQKPPVQEQGDKKKAHVFHENHLL